MHRMLAILALGCLSAGAQAADPHLDNPLAQVSVTVSQATAQVRLADHGRVEFRPEALIVDGRARPLHAARASQSGARITQALGQGVGTWYVNTPFGVEQGFVVSLPASAGQVAIRLGLGGDLLPYQRGTGLAFSAFGQAKHALGYSRLIAYDAEHHRLPARLALDGKTLTLSVDARGARYPITLDPLLSSAPELLTAPEYVYPAQIAPSSDGSVLVVGAPSARTQLGKAYVFAKSGSSWSAVTLSNPVSSGKAFFGYSAAVSPDGQTAIVGAPGNNTTSVIPGVYIYRHGGSGWNLAATLSTTGIAAGRFVYSSFGYAVALSADGHTLLVGAPNANTIGGAYVYTGSGSTWSGPVALSIPAMSPFPYANAGAAVALSSDGKTAMVAAPNAHTNQGAVFVYVYDGSNWSSTPATLASPSGVTLFIFGGRSAISGDGNTILAVNATSSSGPDKVYAYVQSSGSWSAPRMVDSGQQFVFISGLALSSDGHTGLAGFQDFSGSPGEARVYTRSGSTWNAPAELTLTGVPSSATVGTAAALSADGKTAYLGATGTKPVLIYTSPVDISFSVTPSKTGVLAPDTQVTLAFTVQDDDPDFDASNLVLDEVLPAGASYVSSDADSGACHYISSSNSVTCTLAALTHPSGRWHPSVTIQMPGAAAELMNVAGLSADQSLDGAAVLHTSITVQAAGSGGGSSGGGSGGGAGSSGSGGGTFSLLALLALTALGLGRSKAR